MAKEKIKDVEKVRIPDQIRERYQPRKEGQSTFDKVLEQNRLLQKSPQNIQVTLQKAHQQETRVARHQEQGERGKGKQSDEKEKERSKQEAKEERKAGSEAEQRVAGKGKAKGGSEEGGSKGGKGRGFGRALHRKATASLKKGAFTKAAQAAAEGSKFAAKLAAQMKASHLSREFIQKMVNQIVKFVKTGINREGDKEVRLDLHDRIFRGLQLRVALKRGKVSVHFNTSNAEVRELFANSSENIQKELEARGVSVWEIKVT